MPTSNYVASIVDGCEQVDIEALSGRYRRRMSIRVNEGLGLLSGPR
jgi:hypothetical protein